VGKRWTWVAWSMLAVYVVGAGVGMPLMVANGEFQRDPGGQASLILALTTLDLGQRTKLRDPIGLACIPDPEQGSAGSRRVRPGDETWAG
jgi:hypothetical protein